MIIGFNLLLDIYVILIGERPKLYLTVPNKF
jgi:hypothetical protein